MSYLCWYKFNVICLIFRAPFFKAKLKLVEVDFVKSVFLSVTFCDIIKYMTKNK